LGVSVYFDKLLAAEIVELSFCADGSFYFPRFEGGVLYYYLLGGFTSHHAVEFEFLNGFLWLWNALAYQVDIK
jgi:hypothetical protein